MKKDHFLTISTILVMSAFGSTYALAQRDDTMVTPLRTSKTFTDPSPTSARPVAIAIEAAENESNDHARLAGFGAKMFAKADIEDLLSAKDAVGVRFYNAMDSDGTGEVEVLAVAVRSDGSEISPTQTKRHRISNNPDPLSIQAKSMGRYTAKLCVDGVCKSEALKAYSAFFTRSVLSNILDQNGAVGIKVIPGSRKFEMKNANGSIEVRDYHTMMAIGIGMDDRGTIDLGGAYSKSLEPCPTLCPDDKVMLAPAKY